MKHSSAIQAVIQAGKAATAENRAALAEEIASYFADTGEELASPLEVVTVNEDTFLINHAGNNFSKVLSANWELDRFNNITLAKKRKVKKPTKKATTKSMKAGASMALDYFNDDFSLRTARKLYKEYVESDNLRMMAAFMKEIDDLIKIHRIHAGHEDVALPDDDEDDSVAELEDQTEESSEKETAMPNPANGNDNRLTDDKQRQAAEAERNRKVPPPASGDSTAPIPGSGGGSDAEGQPLGPDGNHGTITNDGSAGE